MPFSFFLYFNNLLFFQREDSRRTQTCLHTLKPVALTSLAECTLLFLYPIYRYPFLDSSVYHPLPRTSSTENNTRSSGRSHYSPWKQSFPASFRCWAFLFVHHPKTAWVLKMFPLETQTPYASFASSLFIYTKTGLNCIHCTVVISPTLVLSSLWLGGRQLDKFTVQTSSKLQSFYSGVKWSVIGDYKLCQSSRDKRCNQYCEYWAL